MKNFTSLLLSVLLIFQVGCGNHKPTENYSKPDQAAAVVPAAAGSVVVCAILTPCLVGAGLVVLAIGGGYVIAQVAKSILIPLEGLITIYPTRAGLCNSGDYSQYAPAVCASSTLSGGATVTSEIEAPTINIVTCRGSVRPKNEKPGVTYAALGVGIDCFTACGQIEYVKCFRFPGAEIHLTCTNIPGLSNWSGTIKCAG